MSGPLKGSPELQALWETLEREKLQAQKDERAWKEPQAQLEETTRKRRERAQELYDNMFKETEVELGGPHILETMRGLLAEL